jgi:hypothetical protein
MEDNAYNRMIAEQVKRINSKYLIDEMAKGYMVDDKNIIKNSVRGLGRRRGGDWDTQTALLTHKNVEGGGWFDDVLGTVAHVAPLAMMALGKPKKGGKRGRPRKGGIATGGEMAGEGIFSSILGSIGLGKEGGIATGGIATGGRKRGRPRKGGIATGGIATGGIATGGGWLDDVLGTATNLYKKGKSVAEKYAPLAQEGYELYKKVQKVRKPKEEKKEEAQQEVAQPMGRRGRRGRRGGIATGGMRQRLNARAVGGAYADLEGAGWFDDVLDGVKKVADTAVSVVPLAMKVMGKGKKGGIATGGKKTSNWISHVKAFAKKHKMKYNEALKDPKCKASYKK